MLVKFQACVNCNISLADQQIRFYAMLNDRKTLLMLKKYLAGQNDH